MLPGKFLRAWKVFALNILLSIISRTCLEITEVSGKLLDCLESFQIVLNISEVSGKFWFCLKFLGIVWKADLLKANYSLISLLKILRKEMC